MKVPTFTVVQPFAFDEVTIQKGVSKKSTFVLKQTHILTYTQHAHILVRGKSGIFSYLM